MDERQSRSVKSSSGGVNKAAVEKLLPQLHSISTCLGTAPLFLRRPQELSAQTLTVRLTHSHSISKSISFQVEFTDTCRAKKARGTYTQDDVTHWGDTTAKQRSAARARMLSFRTCQMTVQLDGRHVSKHRRQCNGVVSAPTVDFKQVELGRRRHVAAYSGELLNDTAQPLKDLLVDDSVGV